MTVDRIYGSKIGRIPPTGPIRVPPSQWPVGEISPLPSDRRPSYFRMRKPHPRGDAYVPVDCREYFHGTIVPNREDISDMPSQRALNAHLFPEEFEVPFLYTFLTDIQHNDNGNNNYSLISIFHANMYVNQQIILKNRRKIIRHIAMVLSFNW